MNDPPLDALAESARNRGLKLVRSRVRTPGKRRFGKVGLTDASGKAVFGMDAKGPTAKPGDVQDYLRNMGARDWGASLDGAVLPRRRKRPQAKAEQPQSNVVQLRPRSEPKPKAKPRRAPQPKPSAKPKPVPKPKPPPRPQLREARPGDAKVLVELIASLGHEIDEKSVRKNIAALAKAREAPLVAAVGKVLVGLVGAHRMITLHRKSPVGRITILVVAEHAQGKGIGRMLLEAAEAHLKSAGCRRIEIAVGDRRGGARAFYRHLGYERDSIRFVKAL